MLNTNAQRDKVSCQRASKFIFPSSHSRTMMVTTSNRALFKTRKFSSCLHRGVSRFWKKGLELVILTIMALTVDDSQD